MRRGAWLGLLAALVFAAPARAGTYQVNACTAGATNASWAPFNSDPAAFEVIAGCPFLARSQTAPNRRAGYFQAGWWRLTAPAGTVVDRLLITRDGFRFSQGDGEVVGGVHQGGWVSEGYTEDGRISYGFGTEGCTIPNDGKSISCSWGSKTTPADLDLDAQQVTYQVACIVSTGCDTSNNAGFPIAQVTIYNAVATIRDDVAPALTVGGPLLSGGWHRPSEAISVDAADVTGISSAAGAGGSIATPCNYSKAAPCADVHAALVPSGLPDGTQSITLTVKDAAGNPTSATRTVSIDGTPPSALLRKPVGRTLVVSVGDETSGVRAGQITVGGTPLPTTLRKGRLTAHLPRGNPARADVAVSVTDNAGNTASGIPPRITVPARERVRYGHRVAIHGRLTTPAGAAVGNAAVQVLSTVRRPGAPALRANGITTGRSGRFTVRLAAGPNRTVRIVVPAAGGLLRAARGVPVRVPASSTIHASRHVVGAGARVRFSGTVRHGRQPLPPVGLIVVLQGRSAGAWRTFADTRTTRSGRWHASYRFHGIPGSYPVRLRIRRAAGFPFELGYSPTTTVRVR